LTINARDAMPGGGTLSVSLRSEQLVRSRKDLAAGQYLVLRVEDSGHGMDHQTLLKAVEPFFSTKGPGKGTGLGLSMIHGLAVQLDGALQLDSVVGKGTVAELWLPAAKHALRDVPDEAAPVMGGTMSPLRVLMVDDDALIAMSSVDMLED